MYEFDSRVRYSEVDHHGTQWQSYYPEWSGYHDGR